jgi:hypothetical protein
VKNIVYQVKINDLQHVKARVREAVATVTPNILQAWLFVVPPRKPSLNFIEEDIYSEKTLIISLFTAVNHKCVQ